MGWNGGKSEDHVMGEGEEEDGGLFNCGNRWFPKQFKIVKEADGGEELVKVGVGWDGMGVAEITA